LPKPIRQGFNLHWRPIFEVMEACPGLDVADEDSFEQGIAFLKSWVKYLFKKRRAKPMQWELSTWSRHVQRSSIEKNGTKSDKAALPTGTSHFNKPRKTGTFKQKINPSDHRRRNRQPPRQQRTAVAALPALPADNSSTSSDKDDPQAQASTSRRRSRLAAKRAAAKVLAAAQEDGDSSSHSNSDSSNSSNWYKWASPPLEQLDLPESSRRSTLQLASILATKKAARKAEEDEKAKTEDEKEEWGGNVLDAAIDKLGTRK
jgi:hypothetical protein